MKKLKKKIILEWVFYLKSNKKMLMW